MARVEGGREDGLLRIGDDGIVKVRCAAWETANRIRSGANNDWTERRMVMCVVKKDGEDDGPWGTLDMMATAPALLRHIC